MIDRLQKIYEAFRFLITDYSYEVDHISPLNELNYGVISFKTKDTSFPDVLIKIYENNIFFYAKIDSHLIEFADIYKFYNIHDFLYSFSFYNHKKNFKKFYSADMKKYFSFFLQIKEKFNFEEIEAFYKKYPQYLWAKIEKRRYFFFQRNHLPTIQDIYSSCSFLIEDYSYEVDKVVPVEGMGYAFIGFKNKNKDLPYINVEMEKYIVCAYIKFGDYSIDFSHIYKYFHPQEILYSMDFYHSKNHFREYFSKDFKKEFVFYLSLNHEVNISLISDFFNKYPYINWATIDDEAQWFYRVLNSVRNIHVKQKK
jgi:hypothetical protein